jgi:glucosamine--fructose-6-phosphate aminotransferase (isomerizing)
MNEFYAEMADQPEALRSTLTFYSQGLGVEILKKTRIIFEEFNFSHIIYTGMGSSYFNSLIGAYFLNSMGISADVRDTGEMLSYFKLPKKTNQGPELIIGVSQSGESGELVALIAKWEKERWTKKNLWGITNNPNSTLGQSAFLCIPTLAGMESSVTSKTYVTGILVHYLVARAIAGVDILTPMFSREMDRLITTTQPMIQYPDGDFFRIANQIDTFFGPISNLVFIGQGTALSTVHQATLNLKEISKIPAEGISIGMFRHGPIEVIDSNFRAIMIINDSQSVSLVNQVITKIIEKWGGGKIALISNQTDSHPKFPVENVLVLQNPVSTSYLAPIYEMMLLQPYLCLLAEKKGFIPGHFRNTQKITK